MCGINTNPTSYKSSPRPKTVYKVCLKGPDGYHLPYRLVRGGFSSHAFLERPYRSDNLLTDCFLHPAEGFENGYGYCLFLSIRSAQAFIKAMIGYHSSVWGLPARHIVPVILPPNTRYAEGRISERYCGAGINAIRAERIAPHPSFTYTF